MTTIDLSPWLVITLLGVSVVAAFLLGVFFASSRRAPDPRKDERARRVDEAPSSVVAGSRKVVRLEDITTPNGRTEILVPGEEPPEIPMTTIWK